MHTHERPRCPADRKHPLEKSGGATCTGLDGIKAVETCDHVSLSGGFLAKFGVEGGCGVSRDRGKAAGVGMEERGLMEKLLAEAALRPAGGGDRGVWQEVGSSLPGQTLRRDVELVTRPSGPRCGFLSGSVSVSHQLSGEAQ